MLELNKGNFEEQVLNSQGLVMVDFWSPKCKPCMELMPHVIELAGRYQAVKFGKVNILESRSLAIGQKVLGLPTVVIYRDGKKAAELSRNFTIEDVEAKLQEVLG